MTADVHPINAAAAPPATFPMPAHFKRAPVKAAWNDLVTRTDARLHTKENYFTFEFAATLMAKFRAGKPMRATESKELKKYLIALGLASKDDDGGPPKPKKNAHYFDEPAGKPG